MLNNILDNLYEEMVEVRRHLHQNPELSFNEFETAEYIAKFHEKLGHEVKRNVGGNGVVAYLKGRQKGPTVALRADFDALPIQEETNLHFASQNEGIMHACGHDGHTAILLGLAKALNKLKDNLKGEVVFIHQHAEEIPPGGAKSMIEDGCLDGVDVIFGTHLQSQTPLYEINYATNELQASSDQFNITVKGKGGHGAMPENTKDSILIASQVVVNIQQIISRWINTFKPTVISVCSFDARGPYNIIQDSADLIGTVRCLDEETRDFVESEIERVVQKTCELSNAAYEYTYTRGYPVLVNDSDSSEFIAKTANEIDEVDNVKEITPIMGGEDYAYYVQKVKGCYFFTGAKSPEDEDAYPHHHPKFNFDERALLVGAKVLGKATLDYMNKYS